MRKPKPEIPRPKFAEWLWRRGINLRQAGQELGVSPEQVRLICQPFASKSRRVPSELLAALIEDYTAGCVRYADFFPVAEADRVSRESGT